MNYKVEIKEILSKIIDIEAENEEGALKEATSNIKMKILFKMQKIT